VLADDVSALESIDRSLCSGARGSASLATVHGQQDGSLEATRRVCAQGRAGDRNLHYPSPAPCTVPWTSCGIDRSLL